MRYIVISLIIGLSSCNKDVENNNTPIIEIDELVIVVKDSIPLRLEPDSLSEIIKYVYISLQLEVLEISSDKNWYKVKIGENRGYQLNHSEEYWTHMKDVYQEPKNSLSEIELDVSVFENGNIQNAIRYEDSDYLYKLNSLNLDTNYYVGATHTIHSPRRTCIPPFSVCAGTYIPGHYFFYEGDIEYTDASTYEELMDRYKLLYENGTIKPFYKIKSELNIESINERLICTKLIMDDPSCYPDEYIGTEIEVLNDKNHNVNDSQFLSLFSIDNEYLLETNLNGGVQNLELLYILDVVYSNNNRETIVRRIHLGLVLCM